MSLSLSGHTQRRPSCPNTDFQRGFCREGGERVKSSTGGCTQMFCLVVRILRSKSVRVVGFSRDPNGNSLVQSEITFAGQTVS